MTAESPPVSGNNIATGTSTMRIRRKGGSGSHGRFLLGKSFLTKVAVLIVLGIIVIIQLHFWSKQKARRTKQQGQQQEGGKGGGLRNSREKWVTTESQPFNQGGVAAMAKHLVVVAGHSVTVSGHLEDADKDERDWFLLDYQKNRGLPSAIVLHIRAGLDLAAKDPSALVVFSGGETRAATGPDTEGASYYRVADAMKLWPAESTVRARTISEEFATDSFQNL